MAAYREVPTTETVERPVATEPIATEPVERERPATTEKQEYGMNLAARIISFVGGVILALLAVRFLLILLGANPANGFANFIYSVSHPLVSPFFGLFNYEQTLGTKHFEIATLVAMLVYGLVMALLIRLVTLGSRRRAA